jgi:hypothetical protein
LQNFLMQEMCMRADVRVDVNRYFQRGSGYQHIGGVGTCFNSSNKAADPVLGKLRLFVIEEPQPVLLKIS